MRNLFFPPTSSSSSSLLIKLTLWFCLANCFIQDTSKNPNRFSSISRILQRQARGGLLKTQELDDRVGDGKLLEAFREALKELEKARRRWRKFNKKSQEHWGGEPGSRSEEMIVRRGTRRKRMHGGDFC